MKNTIIGGILMFSGALHTIGIMITAAIFTPSITSWSGYRFGLRFLAERNTELL